MQGHCHAPEMPPTYLRKLVDPIVIHDVFHVVLVFTEQVQRIHEPAQHCATESSGRGGKQGGLVASVMKPSALGRG